MFGGGCDGLGAGDGWPAGVDSAAADGVETGEGEVLDPSACFTRMNKGADDERGRAIDCLDTATRR